MVVPSALSVVMRMSFHSPIDNSGTIAYCKRMEEMLRIRGIWVVIGMVMLLSAACDDRNISMG